MTPKMYDSIAGILTSHRLMTLATLRGDGWPQATTVSYVSKGLAIYCFVARFGQKYANIKRDSRVSVAIAADFSDPMKIKGLSASARASLVDDPKEFDAMSTAFLGRFPEYGEWPKPVSTFSPMLRLTPEIVSVVDYAQGFGHTDTVTVGREDIEPHMESRKQSWFANLLGG